MLKRKESAPKAVEAYDALLKLSTKHNISMRKLASEIIMNALDNVEIEMEGE